MMNKKKETKEEKWEIFEDLRRCLNIYSVFRYIYEKGECIASDIISEMPICKTSVYKYIDKGAEAELLYKDFNKESYKNGAHFMVVARPRLKRFLKEFKTITFKFFNEVTEYHEDL